MIRLLGTRLEHPVIRLLGTHLVTGAHPTWSTP